MDKVGTIPTNIMIINKSDYPDVFYPNDELPEEDIALFNRVLSSDITGKEREFFEKMHEKETGEFAGEADMIVSEYDNADEIYLIRYYFTEYQIGQGIEDRRASVAIYHDNLSETLDADLFPLLGKHITLLNWLREQDFDKVMYFGNFQFDH